MACSAFPSAMAPVQASIPPVGDCELRINWNAKASPGRKLELSGGVLRNPVQPGALEAFHVEVVHISDGTELAHKPGQSWAFQWPLGGRELRVKQGQQRQQKHKHKHKHKLDGIARACGLRAVGECGLEARAQGL